MAIFLKFTGRWAFVQDRARTGPIFAVAPFYGAGFRKHLPVMSIDHEDVKFRDRPGGTTITTRDPMVRVDRIVGRTQENTQLMTWSLENSVITHDGPNDPGAPSSLEPTGGFIPHLQEMAGPSGNIRFDQRALTPGDVSIAVVRIAGAAGKAVPIIANRRVDFRPRNDSQRPSSGGARTLPPSDEVVFALDTNELVLSFNDREGGQVVVKDNAVVGFAHMCAAIRTGSGPVDGEFAQYYNLLTPRPAALSALVPVDMDPGKPTMLAAEGGDCDCITTIDFD